MESSVIRERENNYSLKTRYLTTNSNHGAKENKRNLNCWQATLMAKVSSGLGMPCEDQEKRAQEQ